MAGVGVASETHNLQRVLVHTPGSELSHISPSNYKEFLFNDILYEPRARQEHDELVALLRDVFGVEVLLFEKVLSEAIHTAGENALADLLDDIQRLDSISEGTREALERVFVSNGDAGTERLARLLIEGIVVNERRGELAGMFQDGPYALPPLPNMMLVRDLAVLIGDSVIVGETNSRARAREHLLWRFVLEHSAALEGAKVRVLPTSVEGGNVLALGPCALVIGQGRRTPAESVRGLVRYLGETARYEIAALVVSLPETVAHLDTVLTVASEDEVVIYPPAFYRSGPEAADGALLRISPGGAITTYPISSIPQALSQISGRPLSVLRCGGGDDVQQRRERWWGGTSVLAVQPGKVLAFRSTECTLEEFRLAGYSVLESLDVLHGREDPHAHERCVVAIRGSELTRARSGPHSLVLPLLRDQ